MFWESHSPTTSSYSRQYMAAIFVHDEEQERLARASLVEQRSRYSTTIRTQMLPYTGFTLAEDYHQKYYLQSQSDLMDVFRSIYPETTDFINSTAAARANGYVGGHTNQGELSEIVAVLCSSGQP